MKKFFSALGKYVAAYRDTSRNVYNVARQLLDHKKIVIISERQVTSVPISSKLQVIVAVTAIVLTQWVLYSSLKFFAYEEVLSQKEYEIYTASVTNEDLEGQVSDLHKNLSELNGYFSRIGDFDQLAQKEIAPEKEIFVSPKDGAADVAAIKSDLEPTRSSDKARATLFNIREKVLERITSLENIIDMTGLNIEKVSESNEDLKKAYDNVQNIDVNNPPQGGPYIPATEEGAILFDRDKFEREVLYLSNLEEAIHRLPISSPMGKFWLSSRYGIRKDPFHNTPAMHYGLDFVGPKHSRIYSTAPGVVRRSGQYGAYGKFLEIDHGNGLTTRYGHLHKILVKKGDRVSRGQKIGLQGNTGRSTGAHLHYEVRYERRPLDPENFLKAGRHVF